MLTGAELEGLIAESLADISSGEISAGLRKARQAFEQAQAGRQPRWAAAALIAQGEAHFRLGHYDETASLVCQAIEWVEADLTPGEAVETISTIRAEASLLLGRCAGETDDLDASERYLCQTIDLSRMMGNDRLLVRGLHSLSAGVYMPRGQYALAMAADEEVLSLARKKGMLELAWAPLTTMSWVCWLSGQAQRSAALLEELQQVIQRGSLGEGWAHCIRGHLLLDAGDRTQAAAEFARTRSIGETIGSPELNISARVGMSRLCRLGGDPAAALSWAEDAAAAARRIGYRHLQGMALVECGRSAWQGGDLASAEAHFQAALEQLTPLQARLEMAQARLGLAVLLRAQDRPEAEEATCQALEFIQVCGFHFLLDQERTLAYPLIAAALGGRNAALSKLAGMLVETLQRTPPPPLRVVTLGGLQVWQGRRQVEAPALSQRRAGELLALLLVSPGQRLGLEAAAERLWPERAPEAAQDLLHKASSALRRALEPELPNRFPSRYLLVQDGMAQILSLWAQDLGAWVDFAAFEAACRRGDWDAALVLYRGSFMPESAYAEWSTTPRQHYATLYQEALLEAGRLRFAAGSYAATLDACRRLLALEPWQEQAVLLGMRAALELGDRAAARRLYQALEKSLREELGVAPQSELQALFRSL